MPDGTQAADDWTTVSPAASPATRPAPADDWATVTPPTRAPASAASEPAPPPDTGYLAAFKNGVLSSIRDFAQGAAAVSRKQTEEQQPQTLAEQPVEWGDLLKPGTLAEKTIYGLARSMPQLAGGVGGAAIGSTLGGGPEEPVGLAGGVVGGAAGAAAVGAAQALGPYYASALKETPKDPDAAFDKAVKEASVEGGISGASWAAFGWAPFKSAVKNLMFQAFAVQPGVSAAGQAASNLAEGKPVGEGVAAAIPGAVVGTVVPAAGHALAARAIGHLRGEAAPAEEPGDWQSVTPTAAAQPSGPAPQPGEAIGLKFPNAPSKRATVDQYFDNGQSVRLRFDDGTVGDYLTQDILRDQTEPPPPRQENPAPAGNAPPLSEGESFDLMMAGERSAPQPRRPVTTPTMGSDAIRAIEQADALERAAMNRSDLSDEQRNDMYAQAQKLRRQFGAPTEAPEFTDEQLAAARTARAQPPAGIEILGQTNVPPISRAPTEFTDEQLAQIRAANAERRRAQQMELAQRAAEQPPRPVRRPMDLAEFLAAHGGVQDQTGELRAMDADKWHTETVAGKKALTNEGKFRRRLVTPEGMPPDEARRLAQEAGYLPPEPEEGVPTLTPDDLYEALRENLSGRHVFSDRDEPEVARWQAAQQQLMPLREQMERRAYELGIEPHPGWSDDELLGEIHEREAIMAEGAEADAAADRIAQENEEWLAIVHPELHATLSEEQPRVRPAGEAAPEPAQAANRPAGGERPAAVAAGEGAAAQPAPVSEGRGEVAGEGVGLRREEPRVTRTAPEPASDIAAQIRTMLDGTSAKDAVFVAHGNEGAIPEGLPQSVLTVSRPEGTLLTVNPQKAEAFRTLPVTDDLLARLLGYPETKEEAGASGHPVVLQAKDRAGNVVAESAVAAEHASEEAPILAEQAPEGGGVVEASLPEAQARREELRSAEEQRAGTREAPVKVETPADLTAAERQVNTEPSDAQAKAGNYAKGHVKFHGLDISIENPLGSVRRGVGPDGKPWEVTMPAAYGYIKRTEGADGDHVDVYLGNDPRSDRVFVVDQKDADTGAFDEHKAMLGYPDEASALADYRAAFSDGRADKRIGAVTPMSIDEFKAWLKGNTKRPAAETIAEKPPMTLHPTKHTQKGHDLFAVKLDERVDADRFKELSAAAKKLGGYYSSFRGKGAIPGWQFKDRVSAERFMREEGRPQGIENASMAERAPAKNIPGNIPAALRHELDAYADSIKGDPVKDVRLVGSTAARGAGKDIDLVYDLGRRDLPSDSGAAAEVVQGLIESGPPIDLDKYDSFFKVGDRYFHVSSGAGREVVENTDYAREQAGKPSVDLGTPRAPTTAEKIKRIADLQAERGEEERGEKVAGSPAQSFQGIERGERQEQAHAPRFMTELTPEGRRQLGVAAGLSPGEALRVSKMNWDNLARSPEIVARLDAQWRRGDIQARAADEAKASAPQPIGKNAEGRDLFEDERGVRSYVRDGIRHTEPVGVVPGRGVAVNPSRRGDEFLTAGERQARQPPEPQGDLLSAAERPTLKEGAPGAPASAEADHGLQGPVPSGDARAGAENVHGIAPERTPRPVSPGEERAGAPAPVGAAAEGPGGRPGGAANGRGAGEGNPDRVPPAGEPGEAGAAGRPAPDSKVTGKNFVLEPGAVEEARGRATKARDNVDAIELANRLLAENRPATREEQAILAKYVGWGGLSGAFPDSAGRHGKGLERVGARLKDILTPDEYRAAQRSTQYAHYTSEPVIRAMWDAVSRMGFKGGLVFEPGMGIGHFLGMMPPDIGAKSTYQGIELDHLTARIAKLLYPQSGIRQADFTQTPMPEHTFDLVIGNPPFSDTVIKADPKYAARGFMLHDYFFAKSLDSVRPGGLLGFVTSAGTMNKLDASARRYLAERGEFLGGMRLPSSAFAKNAGTEVTTDILFFKRRPDRADFESLPDEQKAWTETVQRQLPDAEGGVSQGNVSRYFSEHPEMVLGQEGFFDKLYKGRYAVHDVEGAAPLADRLRQALERLPADVMEAAPTPHQKAELDFASGQKKDGSYYLQDGRLWQYRDGVGRPVEQRGAGVKGGMSTQDMSRVRHLIPVRDALRDVFRHDLADNAGPAAEARKLLNKHYDSFVQKFGPLNKAEFQYRRPNIIQQEGARAEAREEARAAGRVFEEGAFDPTAMIERGASLQEIARARANAREKAESEGKPFDEGTFDPEDMPDIVIEKRPNVDPFMDDPESYRLRSIEDFNDATGEAKKKRIFRENILTHEEEPQLQSAEDGILWSLNKHGRLDLDAIADKLGRDRAAVIGDLGDKIFKVPGTEDTYQTADEYLSGDVVSKLDEARARAVSDPDIRRNIPALEAAQPVPLAPSEISMNLGMPWIPTDTVAEFARDHLDLGETRIAYSPTIGTWAVDGDGRGPGMSEWGVSDRDALKLLSDGLNRTPPKIYKAVIEPGGSRKQVFDAVATQAAQDKYDAIRQTFNDWVQSDPDRAARLGDLYNSKLNRVVLRKFDGDYLTTPGVSADWKWRPHQKRVVSRIIQEGNTYMAHAVGAGKTSAMIGAGMEMRRLGLVKKPMYVVPNHMLGQFTKEFYEQYPTARIAVADERRFHTDRRKQFIANVAQDDLDAVIITHSAFGKMPIGEEFQRNLIREQIDAIEESLAELDKRSDRITVKRLENQKEKLEQRLSARGTKKDQVNTFEEMGADFLFVDEAHGFRKLSFATKQNGLKGITPEGSEAAWDLYTKIRYLESKNPGRSAVLASGTPVTNTMGELYTISRFLQPEELKSRGLSHFDSWASTFGDVKTALEQTPDGGYAPVTRFSRFVNIPELYKMVGSAMDIVTPAQLEKYVVRPKLKGGKREFHLAPQTDILKAYQQDLASRVEAIRSRRGPPQKGGDILLSVINDGRHAAIDPRFVDPGAPAHSDSKLNMLIDNVHRIWKETRNQTFYDPKSNYEKVLGKGAATQMIFANLGIGEGGSRSFSGYQWMKHELVRRGVPAKEVAFIKDFKSHTARQKLFNDMNEGKIRILIGSTQKMGTGVNAQRRLYALHNQDPLWFPADDEQRVGRILRQGNLNPEIEVHDYSTKGTYDSTMWQMMGNKGRFIEQFFRGDPELRDMEDLGEASLYEQASAIATADERLITLTDLKQQLDKAQRREQAHDREQFAMRQRIGNAQRSIEFSTKQIAAIENDLRRRQDTKGDAFRMTVGDKAYATRKDAANALSSAFGDAFPGMPKGGGRQLGEIGGFPLYVTKDLRGEPQFHLKMSGDREIDLASSSSSSTIASAEDRLRRLEDGIEYQRGRIAENERTIHSLTPQMGKAFMGGPEIARLRGAVRDLEEQLAPKKPDQAVQPKQGDAASFHRAPAGEKAPQGEEARIARGLVGELHQTALYTEHEAELAEAVDDIAKRMIPGARVRAYGRMRATEETGRAGEVYGATYRTPVGSVIAWSLEAPDARGTVRHEAIHYLKRTGLLDEHEWQTLSDAAEKEGWADRFGIDREYGHLPREQRTEEAVAEAFRAWKGGALKKLPEPVAKAFYRIGLFLRRVAAATRQILGRNATADDIFTRIESGEVGRRGLQPEGAVEAVAAQRPTIDETEQGEQRVIPGAERLSDEEMARRRAQQQKTEAEQRMQGPARGKPGQRAVEETPLFGGKGEQGTLFQRPIRPEEPGVPREGKDYLDNVSDAMAESVRGSAPGTYERLLSRMSPSGRGARPTKFLGAFERFAIMPRTLAATDWRSARYWEMWRAKDDHANGLRHEWSQDSAKYIALSPEQREKLHAVEELDRLNNVIRPDDGRRIVARNEGQPEAEFSKPGQSVALDPETTAAYHERRDLFRKVWRTLMDASAKRLGWAGSLDPAVIREAAEEHPDKATARRLNQIADLMQAMSDQEKTGYVPLMRFGDYFIAVKAKPGTEPDSLGGFPKVARFELVDSKTPFDTLFGKVTGGGGIPKAARDRIAELRKRYPEEDFEIEHGHLSRHVDALRKLDIPALEKLFIALGQKDSELFGPMVEKLRDQLYEELKAGFKKRSNTVPGYSKDFERATGAYLGWTSNHAADLLYGEHIRMAQEANIDTHPDPAVRQYWQQWTDYQKSARQEMQALRQFGFYWTLAGNPSSTALIATHGPMVAHATLGAGIGYGKAGKALYGALGEAVKAIRVDTKTGLHVDLDRMGRTTREKALIDALAKTGTIHAAAAEDIRGLGQGDSEALRPYRKQWRRMLDIASSNIAVADQVNRVGVALAVHRLAQNPGTLERIAKVWGGNQVFREMAEREGLTPETVARFMVDEGLFVWGQRNRAPIQRGTAGTMLFQFRNFEMNYLSTLWKMMHRMGPEGKGAALFMLAGLGMLGGALGLPFAGDAEKAYDAMYHTLTGIDPQAEATIYRMMEDAGFSKLGAEMILRGPARSVLGVDLSSRLGFGTTASENLTPTAALGVVPSMLYQRSTMAWNRYQHGQPVGAAADLLPTAARNLVRGTTVYPEEGVQTQYGSTVIPKGEITSSEEGAQALGFEPTKIARAYENREYVRRAAEASRDLRSRILAQAVDIASRAMEAERAGHLGEAERLHDDLARLYADHPTVHISAEALREGMLRRHNPEAAALRHAPKGQRGAIVNSPFVAP